MEVRKRQNYPRNPTNFKGYLNKGNTKILAKYFFCQLNFFRQEKKGEGFLADFFKKIAFYDGFREKS